MFHLTKPWRVSRIQLRCRHQAPRPISVPRLHFLGLLLLPQLLSSGKETLNYNRRLSQQSPPSCWTPPRQNLRNRRMRVVRTGKVGQADLAIVDASSGATPDHTVTALYSATGEDEREYDPLWSKWIKLPSRLLTTVGDAGNSFASERFIIFSGICIQTTAVRTLTATIRATETSVHCVAAEYRPAKTQAGEDEAPPSSRSTCCGSDTDWAYCSRTGVRSSRLKNRTRGASCAQKQLKAPAVPKYAAATPTHIRSEKGAAAPAASSAGGLESTSTTTNNNSRSRLFTRRSGRQQLALLDQRQVSCGARRGRCNSRGTQPCTPRMWYSTSTSHLAAAGTSRNLDFLLHQADRRLMFLDACPDCAQQRSVAVSTTLSKMVKNRHE
jgi:hypothetical protein